MSTLWPDGITKEMAEEARSKNDKPEMCDKDNGALLCLASGLTNVPAEDIVRFEPLDAAFSITLAKAMSTGIYLAKEYPEWALLAQQELADAFHKRDLGNGEAPSSTEALRVITDFFVQRHPMQHTNQEQDVDMERSKNERAHLQEVDAAYEAGKEALG